MDMRKLWEDHITWTRNYIISALADIPDLDPVAKRLLKNQDDIGDAVAKFYGADAGSKLSGLLRDHIMIAGEVVKAAKAGNNDQVQAQQQKWTANAKDIATFLSGANPNWSRRDLEDMLQKHLDFTTTETVSRLKKDWASDIKAYDDNHIHMLMFSDMLTRRAVSCQVPCQVPCQVQRPGVRPRREHGPCDEPSISKHHWIRSRSADISASTSVLLSAEQRKVSLLGHRAATSEA